MAIYLGTASLLDVRLAPRKFELFCLVTPKKRGLILMPTYLRLSLTLLLCLVRALSYCSASASASASALASTEQSLSRLVALEALRWSSTPSS